MRAVGLDVDGSVICHDPALAREDERFPDGRYNCGETLEEFAMDGLLEEERVTFALQGIMRILGVWEPDFLSGAQ